MVDAGLITISTLISPFEKERLKFRNLFRKNEFIEVFVDTPLSICEERDPKGLYNKARKGEIKNFTGIDSEYQRPLNPDIHLNTMHLLPQECVEKIVNYLIDNHFLPKSSLKIENYKN